MANLQAAQAVIGRLTRAGFQAVLVGGCVRDLLLGRPVHDWDIATAALPQTVLSLFPKCIPTGLRHGTVTVLQGGEPYEVTTFRADGDYLDGRRPETVRFVPDLCEDLKRRDFTINAMALDSGGGVIDPTGGRADLQRRRIACVGNPDERFGEDALRMLRALRFSAQLDFTIDPPTLEAIARNAPGCAKLSAERVQTELEKTLCSDRPQLAGQMLSLGLLAAFVPEGAADLSPLAALPNQRAVRWAGFCRLVPEADLRRLRLDKKTIVLCRDTCKAYEDAPSPLGWRRMAAHYGWQVAQTVAALNRQGAALDAVRAQNPCVSLAELAVCGADFPELPGREVGQTLNRLLDHVLEYPGDNEKQTLLRLLRETEK